MTIIFYSVLFYLEFVKSFCSVVSYQFLKYAQKIDYAQMSVYFSDIK